MLVQVPFHLTSLADKVGRACRFVCQGAAPFGARWAWRQRRGWHTLRRWRGSGPNTPPPRWRSPCWRWAPPSPSRHPCHCHRCCLLTPPPPPPPLLVSHPYALRNVLAHFFTDTLHALNTSSCVLAVQPDRQRSKNSIWCWSAYTSEVLRPLGAEFPHV